MLKITDLLFLKSKKYLIIINQEIPKEKPNNIIKVEKNNYMIGG